MQDSITITIQRKFRAELRKIYSEIQVLDGAANELGQVR